MPRLLRTVADRANACPRDRTSPTSFDASNIIRRQPFKGRTTGARMLIVRVNKLEAVMVCIIPNNRLNCSIFQCFVTRMELAENVRVTQV